MYPFLKAAPRRGPPRGKTCYTCAMNKKGYFVVLIVVIVLILAGGIWYYEAQTGVTAPLYPPTPPIATSTANPIPSSTITYVNTQYGFTFTLPASWAGYSIVTSTWTGNSQPPVSGPILSIRNPAWTASVPTQDIPIMVFTPNEWFEVSTGTLAVSAAPIPPSELGQNSQYVFALPARYNYAYPADYQEVQDILAGNPLTATN